MAAVNWYSQPGAVLYEPLQWQAPFTQDEGNGRSNDCNQIYERMCYI